MGPGEINRWTIERAIKESSLPSPSRLLLFTLLTHVDRGTTDIPPRYAPSLTTLARQSGLGRSAVAKHLNQLEEEGWLLRIRPASKTARASGVRTGYRMRLPAGPRDAPVTKKPEVTSSPPDGLEVDHEDGARENVLFSAGPRGGLAEEPDASASARGGLADEESQVSPSPEDGLVHEVDHPSPRGGPIPKHSQIRSSPTEKNGKGGVGGNNTAPGKITNRGDNASGEHPRFGEWYAAYPIHKARGAAVRAFTKAAKKTDPQTLIDAARRYRTDPQVVRGYGKHPATWLNQECWLDEPTESPTHSDQHEPYRNPTDHDVYYEDF